MRCDALVVGGGPAGSTAALLLARAGWRVVIVEHARFPRRKVCGEYISASTWPLLMKLGVGERLAVIAGRAVTHVGLFAGRATLTSKIASHSDANPVSGRAIGRDAVDAALLDAARDAGAVVFQPWSFVASTVQPDRAEATIENRETGERCTIDAAIVIDAHGAWEVVDLPGSSPRAHRASDLLGFKAHFDHASLSPGLMPLLAFSGGYGGMVETDRRRTSLSLCIRRDALADCRQRYPKKSAGDAVLAHIRASCAGVDDALSQATPSDRWIAAGPLATGIRGFGSGRVFAVGNAAAEAHPVIAEGISMAIQSSALLAQALIAHQFVSDHDVSALGAIHARYEAQWREHFTRRLQAAAFFAHVFMRALPTAVAVAAIRTLPSLLTLGASFAGKSSTMDPGAIGASAG